MHALREGKPTPCNPGPAGNAVGFSRKGKHVAAAAVAAKLKNCSKGRRQKHISNGPTVCEKVTQDLKKGREKYCLNEQGCVPASMYITKATTAARMPIAAFLRIVVRVCSLFCNMCLHFGFHLSGREFRAPNFVNDDTSD